MNRPTKTCLALLVGCVALSALARPAGSVTLPVRDEVPDSVADDTLRSVIVTPDGRLPIPKVKREDVPRTKSLSDILGAKLTDQIMHPFAFSQRKRERHRRKMMKILREYDLVKTPREEIIEALRAEGINVDSLLQLNEKNSELKTQNSKQK